MVSVLERVDCIVFLLLHHHTTITFLLFSSATTIFSLSSSTTTNTFTNFFPPSNSIKDRKLQALVQFVAISQGLKSNRGFLQL